MLPQVDTLLLDAGNTLITIDFAFVAELLSTHGVAIDAAKLETAEQRLRPSFSRAMQDRVPEAIANPFRFFVNGILDAALERQLTPREIDQIVADLYPDGTSQRMWSRLMPAVLDSLRTLKQAGYRMAVASNSDGTVEVGLARHGITPFMDEVFDSHLVGYSKPDPRFFHHAIQRLGCDPKRTLHVGDMYFADVLGARAAGIHPVLLDPGGHWGRLDCLVFRDLAHLTAHLINDPPA